ncbi:MAG: hypothetical protein ACP5JJ_13010 [Anaerolineae bacterium]
MTAVKDFHFKQTDITKEGRIFSTVVVILFNIIWVVVILSVVANDHSALASYAKGSVVRGLDGYGAVLELARPKIPPVWERVWETIQQI